MSLKKAIAAGVVAVSLSTAVTPAATAASSTPETTNTWENQVNPNFKQGEETSSLTGSSPLDLGIIIGGSVAGAALIFKLVTDFAPALLTQGVPNLDLERLARDNGLTQLADQIAALKG
ncbi:hypothetical protein QP414_06265 [Corynebacterium simulans]|uniref:hypothetical protein n=1 Tax=Corynebacterium simulans TaxID=146827 RepID=UPI001EF37516|nr:hypothetical protein [Corynebacterium simulans]MCG7248021.1 hypothetical protein [Corynebacterium simulans]MDK7138912.1 hypothetical protein [Corynebacterium simulans]